MTLYRILKKYEIIQAGDEWWDSFYKKWKPIPPTSSMVNTPLLSYNVGKCRRPVNKQLTSAYVINIDKGYRLLKDDEIVQEGDEINYIDFNGTLTKWISVNSSVGSKANDFGKKYLFRRKIDNEPQLSFLKELKILINKHSKENGSNTPDFILAEYLQDCLEVFNKNINRRQKWYGRDVDILSDGWRNKQMNETIELVVIVNGNDVLIKVKPSYTLMTIRNIALAETDNTSRPQNDWEIRNEKGQLLNPEDTIEKLNLKSNDQLFVSLQIGCWG